MINLKKKKKKKKKGGGGDILKSNVEDYISVL